MESPKPKSEISSSDEIENIASDLDDMLDMEDDNPIEELPEDSVTISKVLKHGYTDYDRPPMSQDPRQDLDLMVIDVDYSTSSSPYKNTTYNDPSRVDIRMYGITKEGNTVLAIVHGFLSYFYVQCPPELDLDNYSTFEVLK